MDVVFLITELFLATKIWWIPHNINFFVFCMWAYCVPIDSTGISIHYMPARSQWKWIRTSPEFITELVVHLMLRKPKGQSCRVTGIFIDLNAVELCQLDA